MVGTDGSQIIYEQKCNRGGDDISSGSDANDNVDNDNVDNDNVDNDNDNCHNLNNVKAGENCNNDKSCYIGNDVDIVDRINDDDDDGCSSKSLQRQKVRR